MIAVVLVDATMRAMFYLQLGLDAEGLASSIDVSGSERGGGEIGVVAAHAVGGGSAGDEEAGEDGSGAGDGRHCECVWLGGWVLVMW